MRNFVDGDVLVRFMSSHAPPIHRLERMLLAIVVGRPLLQSYTSDAAPRQERVDRGVGIAS